MRRPVACRLGCGLKVPYEEREHHENNVCTRPCMWCGERIGPESRRRLHERFHCPKRHVQCPNLCGVEGVAEEDMERHCIKDCPLYPSACPNGCAWTGYRREVRIHIDGESGSCPERKRRCRYDMLGRRIRFRTNEQPPCHSHEQYKAAETAFSMMDSDGDGELTASEIYNALVKLGMPQSIDYVRDIVEKADEDGNGTVSRREYLDACGGSDPGGLELEGEKPTQKI